MQVFKLNIGELTPYKNNAKVHTEEQIEQIKESIKVFGNNDPIAVWGDKNIIVEGHGRYEALKQLNYEEVNCIRLDHLSDEERKAYTIVHNKLTMNTGFNVSLLDSELEEIELDMDIYGFNTDEEINIDDFYNDKGEVEKKAKTCPNCGYEL